ncbi:chitinase [Purpureocillium lavendulum]|uniref:Chitinase n=1 Tax=Purpureocillium lavendulum TaxID=1247861 RepID=A0AB34FF32_9HYPO|nr:chitinase [Purpureocillium lavendulum]
MNAKPAAASVMEFITEEMHDCFRTSRLEFVRIDDNKDQIKAFIQKNETPDVQALASLSMPMPYGKADADRVATLMTKALLGAAIFLRPDEAAKHVVVDDDGGKEVKAQGSQQQTTGGGGGGIMIGTICLGWGGVTPQLFTNRSASLGIAIARRYQNRGYGREAIDWMLDWAFRHGGLHTVRISALSYNDRAVHLYEKMGFVLEGRLRDSKRFNRKWYDEVLFSMKEGEWAQLRGIATEPDDDDGLV